MLGRRDTKTIHATAALTFNANKPSVRATDVTP